MMNLMDKGIAMGLEQLINQHIKDFGKVESLDLNTKEKKIDMELTLEGEPRIVTVTINKFEITRKDEKDYLRVKEIKTSKAWMNIVMQKYLPTMQIEIPSKFAQLAKMLLG